MSRAGAIASQVRSLPRQSAVAAGRAVAWLKAALVHVAGRGARWGAAMLGRTRFNYAAWVQDGRGNAMTMAVVLWFSRTFPEAPLHILTKRNGEWVPLDEHPLTDLLTDPNPYYPGELLWWGTLADWMLTGNGYWIKVRSAMGRVVQLWWAPASVMKPVRPDDGSVFISHYEYSPNGVAENYDPRDVVHFRYGLNPNDGGLTGLSPLASLLREVFTDDQAANFTAMLLKNLGVPGVILAPKGDDTEGDPKQIKQVFQQTFGDDNVGEPLVLTAPTDVSVLSFNPQQMELSKLRRIPEERVTALFGIPAVVIGLGAGLDRSTYNNVKEAREAAYEQNVIPSQRLLAAQIRTQLLPDFGDNRRLKVGFDLTQVRVLQDDQNALATRTVALLTGGQIMLDEARAMVGKPPVEGGRGQVFYMPSSVQVVKANELGEPPEPEPEAAMPPTAPDRDELPRQNGRAREPVAA